MKAKLISSALLLALTFSNFVKAQSVAINITGATATASSILDISSTTLGLLIPRMTTGNRNAIATPATGLLVYDTSLNLFYYYNGTAWVPLFNSTLGWSLTGNALSTGLEFIGSTNAFPFAIYTNNIERMRILSSGFVGIGTTTPAYLFTVMGAAANSYIGRFENSTNNGFGAIIGRNMATTGASTGNGVVGMTSQSQGFGLYGANIGTTVIGTGVLGIGNNTTGSYLTNGSGGAFTGTNFGIAGYGNAGAGTGITASGQGIGAFYSLIAGSGGAFAGSGVGVYGYSTGTGNNTWGGYFSNGSGNAYAYVGGRVGGTDYKINGVGAVSTIVKDLNGKSVNMFCPEAPEILFQDFGQGKLINGKCHISIDPVFSNNVVVNDKHPLRVFIQLNGDCKGVYVINRTKEGFDVIELDGGSSNAEFTYYITANRIDTYDENGNMQSKYTDVRFPDSPQKQQTVIIESKTAKVIEQ
jgi:hypothetical protein